MNLPVSVANVTGGYCLRCAPATMMACLRLMAPDPTDVAHELACINVYKVAAPSQTAQPQTVRR